MMHRYREATMLKYLDPFDTQMLDVKGIKPGYKFSFATSQTFEI
jgi:hypothetical protein